MLAALRATPPTICRRHTTTSSGSGGGCGFRGTAITGAIRLRALVVRCSSSGSSSSSSGGGSMAPHQQQRQRQQRRVAVIGAGAAGLAAAKELLREGHSVVVFEQARGEGGVWVYSDAVDADPLGSDDPTQRAHSSM